MPWILWKYFRNFGSEHEASEETKEEYKANEEGHGSDTLQIGWYVSYFVAFFVLILNTKTVFLSRLPIWS